MSIDRLHDSTFLRTSVDFLQRVQTILSDGSFVSTYKFALLHTLCDVAVRYDRGDVNAHDISIAEIAERFAELYWKQTSAYGEHGILKQNNGNQAAMIKLIEQERAAGYSSMAKLRQSPGKYQRFVKKTERLLNEMPLWRLQKYRGSEDEFLYTRTDDGLHIRMQPGVIGSFSLFGSFITEMARNKWELMVRRLNQAELGDSLDLNSFLFGADRASLQRAGEILYHIQKNKCFYCGKEIKTTAHVDHFISWSRYTTDLAHNFVLADSTCNLRKSDSLAADAHLDRWLERNEVQGSDYSKAFVDSGLDVNLDASDAIARWAYRQAVYSREQLWLKQKTFEVPQQSVLDFIGAA